MTGKLARFFHLSHPTRGDIAGPWARLGSRLQKLTLDLACVWREWDNGTLERNVDKAVAADRWAKDHWNGIR
jgi:hypothetical protein